jgi:DNA-binding FadR family transcriptional regulator
MIKRMTLCDSIVEEIKLYIQKNNYKPGDKLPNQLEFCEMLGVSRTSLREALKILQAVNAVEIKNGKGIYMKKTENYKIQADISMEDKKRSLLEMLEIRKGMEGLAVKLSAERATDDEIAEIERMLKIMSEKSSKGESDPVEDKSFHKAIYYSSKNIILIDMLDNLYVILDIMWNNPLGIGSAMNEFKLHKRMFDHIKNREAEKAEKVFWELIDSEIIMLKYV